MKITAFLVFLFSLHLSAATLAQTVTLSEHKVPLEKVLNDIRQQSGYVFFYNQDWMQQSKPVDLDVKDLPLEQALKAAFKDQPFDYAIVNKTIVLKLKEKPATPNVPATPGIISGSVVDGTNQPMVGVSIREKGTDNGTQTDAKGKFQLALSNDAATVTFSYIGYETKEISAKELVKGTVITLNPAENNLREVVINKGYYVERQELSTGDVSSVSGKTITDQPLSEPIQTLEGRVPGLFIQQSSGLPGSFETILIRGANSIANGNSPLFVIDGVPISSTSLTSTNLGGPLGSPGSNGTFGSQNFAGGLSPFNALNPDDIENIEVLKDADATAIYGSRGANGVILITTKKGKAGNTVVSFDLKSGDSKVAHFIDLMNTQQYLQMRHEAFALDALPFPSLATNPTDQNFDVDGAWDTTRNTNWQKKLIGGTAHFTDASLSISGGSENTQFFVSSAFNRQTTVFPGDFDDAKGAINFNVTHTSANKRFQFQLSGGYIYDDNNLPNTDLTGIALRLAPDAPALYNENGGLNWQPIGGTASWNNPVSYLLDPVTAISGNLTGHALLSYNILPGLSLQTSLGYTDQRMNQTMLFPGTASAPPNDNNPDYRNNNYGNSESSGWIVEPGISYTRKFGKGNLDAYLGSEFQQNNFNSAAYYAYGFASDALITNVANASGFGLFGITESLYRYNAVRARIGYTWNDKYVLNVTGNRDGSSRFGSSKQWGDFGAIGAGWVFSKEGFISNNISWLNFGKLRASYGVTGSDQIGEYQYLSSYSSNSTTYQGNTGLFPTQIPNPYYSWEIDKKLEGGIELGFLKDRISLTANYYRNRTGNQLVGYQLPYLSGFTSVQYNLPAVVQNSGVELTLNTTNVHSSDFRWSTALNFSTLANKLVSYPDLATSDYKNRYVIGQPIFVSKHYNYIGVNPTDGVYQFKSASGSITEAPIYPADLTALQNFTPKFEGGLNNSFSYKGVQLDVFFTFRKQMGLSYLNNSNVYDAGQFNFNFPVSLIGNTWQHPGDMTEYGRLSTQSQSNPNYAVYSSSLGLTDASFIRLKNAVLSYTLPKSWEQVLHVQSLRLFVQGQNLLTFTHYQGLDPEEPNLLSGLPPLRTIVLGIHASL